MSNKKIGLIYFFLCSFFVANAQKDTSIKANKVNMFCINAQLDLPMGNMAKRYGESFRVGASFLKKNERNFLWGVKLDFITGNKVVEDSFLNNLLTVSGGIIDQTGQLFRPSVFERGYIAGVEVGKVLNFWNANVNSGPMWLTGVGFMQHKIKFFDRDNLLPQFKNGYYKGYDRLTNGMYLEQYLGYLYFGKKKAITLHGGLDFLCGFTQGRRTFIYDLGVAGNDKRIDILTGVRAGIIVPIFKRHIEEVYY